VLDNYKEVIDGLETTNESIINQKQNRILRILTVLTLLFMPPTLATSLFGMNTGVPWQGHIYGFWIVAGALSALGVGMLAAFKLARWL
jgi:magnesium transporter